MNAVPEEVLQLLASSISARAILSKETDEGVEAMDAGVARAFVLQLRASRPMPYIPKEHKALHLGHARHLLGLVGSGMPSSDVRYSRVVEAGHKDIILNKHRSS